MKIPKIIHKIWVGDKPAPTRWINTWVEKHPDWEHILWDNDKVYSRKWINEKHIGQYTEEGLWHGVADIIRYEILYEYGGIVSGADSICINPIDELFDNDYELFVPVDDWGQFIENPTSIEEIRVSPLYASTKGHQFVKKMIEGITKMERVGTPYKSVGNRYTKKMILKYKPRIKLLPAYHLVPTYKDGTRYKGNGKIYAEHKWGSTFHNYDKGV